MAGSAKVARVTTEDGHVLVVVLVKVSDSFSTESEDGDECEMIGIRVEFVETSIDRIVSWFLSCASGGTSG